MTFNIANNNTQKAGLCPHGLPPGACPICSGGGGGIKKMDRNTRRHPGEMTWNECYAIGQMMKAAKARKEAAAEHAEQVALQNANLTKGHNNFVKSVVNFVSNIPLVKPMLKLSNKIASNIANFTSKISNFINKQVQNIKNTFKNVMADISDKIAAIFGEEKLAKLKNLEKFAKRATEKILSIFGFVKETEKEDKDSTEQLKKEEKKISFLAKVMKKIVMKKDGKAEHDS